MKILLPLLIASLALLSLSACGSDNSSENLDLFKQENTPPSKKQTPIAQSSDFASQISDNVTKAETEPVPEDESGQTDNPDKDINLAENPEAGDDNPVAEDSPSQADETVQIHEPPQLKTPPSKTKNLEDIPPVEESDRLQDSSSYGNNGSGEASPDENTMGQE